MSDGSEWWSKIDTSKLDEDSRYLIIVHLTRKYGNRKLIEETGISRVTLWRLLTKKSPVKPEYVQPLLKLLTLSEFESLITAKNRLKSIGVLRDDGTVDYSLVLEILSVARSDEYLKNALLRFVVQEFREDLRKLLGLGFTGLVLSWTDEFEVFLSRIKRRRKIQDPQTIKYYKNLFKKYLEGKELNEELVNYVINHRNGWLRNVFRHYIQYLYYKRKITPELFGWIMEIVPSRGYKLDVRPYQVSLDNVRKTMRFLRENHELYYLLYRLMLESGIRLSHALLLLSSWSPRETVLIATIGLETERLVCFYEKGFCRYYLGLKVVQKPCEWVYMSRETAEAIDKVAPIKLDRNSVRKYAKRHRLITPKMLRKVSWRVMVQAMAREVARFVQSRFGELRVSEARYGDLLAEADATYALYLEKLMSILEADQSATKM